MPVPHILSRATGVLAAAALALSTAAAVPSVAHAADGQVCTTAPAPTPATQPWYDFAHAENPVWAKKSRFTALYTEISAALQKLGPTSTQAQVDTVEQAFMSKFTFWQYGLADGLESQYLTDAYGLLADLLLIDPALVAPAEAELSAGLQTLVVPHVQALTIPDGLLDTFLIALLASFTTTFPLTGPVVVPSAAAVTEALGSAAQGFDQWHDTGNAHVVWGGPTTTCVTTATLSVPSAATVIGRATTVTVGATRDAAPVRGDYVVLLDGEQIGSATQQSSYVATIPATLAAGAHVLTVAFAPVDGSPIATRSSTVTVARAATTTALKLSKTRTSPGKSVKATIRVAVPGTALSAGGSASIKVGKKTLKATVRNGRATLSLGRLSAGRYKLRAVFAGSESLGGSTSSKVTLKVTG